MKKVVLLLAIMIVATIGALAQNPIKWRTSVSMTSETEGVVTMKAVLQQGWHLYGTELPAGGPKATKFDFSASQGVQFVGTPVPSIKPVEKHDAMFNLTLNWWDKNVTFTQKFKVTDATTAKIVGVINYMGCNDETCAPPKKEKISIVVSAYKK